MKSLILILTVALVASNFNHICELCNCYQKKFIVHEVTKIQAQLGGLTLDGLIMEGHVAYLGRCKCLKYISLPFSPKQVKHIQVILQGIHCRRMEIILTLINGWKFCIHPNTPWVTQLLKKLTKS